MRWISARRIGKSAGFGLLAAVAFAAVAILVVPTIGYPVLFAPGVLLAPVLGPLFEVIASRFEFDGGAELGVGLLLVCALTFWWFIFAAIIAALRNDPVA